MSAKKKKEEIPAYERRLKEANRLIRDGWHRDAVESAGGGIDLLMKALYEELKKKLHRHDQQASGELHKAYNQYVNRPKEKFTFGRWIDFYEKKEIFERLEGVLRRKFIYFNPGTLRAILKVRNDCLHEDYQPTSDEADFVCRHLAMFLKETNRAPQEIKQDKHWTSDWRQKWDGRIRRWQERNIDSKEADMVRALVDQLVLVVDLIGDNRVPGEIKSQLMQVVIYVIDPDDFIPEGHTNVHGLVDDAAVLALTLYWLDNTGIIDPAISLEHWVGKEDPIKVTNDLYQSFLENHKILFSDEVWAVISSIAEKGPRVLWQMPK